MTSKYIYDPAGHLLAEATASATPTLEHIYLGDRLVAQYNPVTLKLLTVHTDRMGSPMLVNDKTATLQWKSNYLPYGQTVNTSGSATQNVRLPGQYADASTSLYDNGFRTYSEGPSGVSPGRYMQADPIGLGGGLNPYAYVGGKPMIFIDPWGLEQKLSYDTLRGGPNQWQWVIQWRLSNPSPNGGWIIQETTPDGKPPFWEAWHVSSGKHITDTACRGNLEDDTDQGMFYTGKGVNFSTIFYEGLTLPDYFIPGNPNTSGLPSALPATPTNPVFDPNFPNNGTSPVKRRWKPDPY